MASSNNSIANNSIAENKKKTKKPETSTPMSKIKNHGDIEKSKDKKNKNKKKEENKNNTSKKLKFPYGNSKENVKKHSNDEEEEEAKTHVFPMTRIRMIMKGGISDLRVSQEAILAINKASEMFLEQLAEEAYAFCAKDRKKYLSYNHLSHVVSKQRRYDFLSDFVPEKVKAEDALRETNSRGYRG